MTLFILAKQWLCRQRKLIKTHFFSINMLLSFVHNESGDICYDSQVMMPLNANYVIHKARASNHKKTNVNPHGAALNV